MSGLESGSLLSKLSLPIYLFCLASQFLLSFWIIPEKLFGTYAKNKQKEVTKNHLIKFGLVDTLDQLEIDWDEGKVNQKEV